MTKSDNKFDKFQFDTDFFEVLSPAEVAAAEEADQAREQAYEEGFAAGKQKQTQEMQTQLQQQIQALQSIADEVQHQQDAYTIALGRQALTIVTQVLNQLLDHAAENYPQDILEQHLKGIIAELPQNMPLTLKIHPDAATFHEKLQAPEATIQNCSFAIQTDPQIPLGDCVAIWENGGIEAGLSQAKQQLTDLLNNTPPNPTIAETDNTHNELGTTPQDETEHLKEDTPE
ncbi:MAG: FliH/SctL family protein [Alphaproteobacteria bacterium]|nr:FliH/SctL family protein [Alphaproteobacteria bacterium]MDD9919159.1 FliH/SctL family protein [Alphaproteobacteria bacterium]